MKPLRAAPLNPLHGPQKRVAEEKPAYTDAPIEMRKAAEGLEAAFTEQMVKSMRDTVEPSEFSLRNNASDIYQGMLDTEYAETAARANSLGLSEQIVDYWLRSQGQPTYNNNRAPKGSRRTGGTNEDQSSE